MLHLLENERSKRPHESTACAEDTLPPSTKRHKAAPATYPPHVWDNLSKITLTRKALREFDRRTKEKALDRSKDTSGVARRVLRSDTRRLEKLAKKGGPDLSRLRGYADHPTTIRTISKRSSGSGKRHHSHIAGSSVTGRTNTSGPYDGQFEQMLIDQGVYPDRYRLGDGNRLPVPGNIDEIRERLARAQSSLSPSEFPEPAFQGFQDKNARVKSEQQVIANVIPIIIGKEGEHESALDVAFNNLKPFHSSLIKPKPDKYYGARPDQIDSRVRTDIGQYIIPSTSNTRPAAPNFFVEVKGPSGGADVLQRQAMYAGAVGARSMLHLQSYGQDTPTYDNNAYSITASYHAGTSSLAIYATHPTQSASGPTQYHMTKVAGYDMTGDIDGFRRGAAAFHNARDLSKEHRDRLIAEANETARALPLVTTPTSVTASRNNLTPAIGGGSVGSCKSTDKLSSEYEQPLKRRRIRATSVSGSHPESTHV